MNHEDKKFDPEKDLNSIQYDDKLGVVHHTTSEVDLSTPTPEEKACRGIIKFDLNKRGTCAEIKGKCPLHDYRPAVMSTPELPPNNPRISEEAPTTEEWEEVFIEAGAEIEHTRWAKWQEYFFGKCIEQRNDGKYVDLTLPVPLYERWKRQIATPYSELSEPEKESDRREVRSYLPLIHSLLASERARALEGHFKRVHHILNKYSKTRAEGGLDYVAAFEEMEGYEHELFRRLTTSK